MRERRRGRRSAPGRGSEVRGHAGGVLVGVLRVARLLGRLVPGVRVAAVVERACELGQLERPARVAHDGVLAAVAMGPELRGRMDVAVVVRRVLHQLAVVVPVAARDRDQARCLEDEVALLAFRPEAVRRPTRDDDVVAVRVGQVAEDRLQRPRALVDEDHLVALAVPEEVVHLLGRAAQRDLDVPVPHQELAAGHLVAFRLDAVGGEVAVRMGVGHPFLALDRLEVAELLDPAGREVVVEDRLVPGEPLEPEDLLGQQGSVVPELDVPFPRHLAQTLVERHGETLSRARFRPDAVSEHADALDLELHDVAGAEPAAVAELEDAAAADGAGTQHVAGEEARVPRGVRDDCGPGVVHDLALTAGALPVFDADDHRRLRAVELVRRHDDPPEAGGEVLPLGGPEAGLQLGPLEIARRPVVHDREAADPALGADDRGHLELVVELLRALRVRNLVLGTEDRGRAREVEDGLPVPLRRHVETAGGAGRPDVLLEGVEVADRGRVEDRRSQVDLRERVFGVPPRAAAAREEGLERLRGELDHDVALEHARPAALQAVPLRAEHAELHLPISRAERRDKLDPRKMRSIFRGYGSVWTITSAMSGRSRRISSSILLAYACASESGLAGSSPSVRNAMSPSSVCRNRSLRGGDPVVSRTILRTASASPAVSVLGAARPGPGSASGSRCVCTAVTPSTESWIARSTSLAIACASSSVSSPGSLRCSETSVSGPTWRTLTLWISRTRGTCIAAAWARSRIASSPGSGSTWTTTSLSGSARWTASSTASAAACPCSTAAPGGTPITTSAKCRPAAWRIRRRRSSTAGRSRAIASVATSCASAGTRSMSTSTFRRISRPAARRTSTATSSADP